LTAESLARDTLRLVSGEETKDRSDADVGEMLKRLAASKVHLLPLNEILSRRGNSAWHAFTSDELVRKELDRQKCLRDSLVAAFRPVGEALAAADITAVLFKSPGVFPYLSSNLDVLVPTGTLPDADEILKDLGHIPMPHYQEDHKLLFRTFDSGRASLSVHLHDAVSWGKVLVLEGDGVAGRSVEGEVLSARVSSPQDCLATTLAHSILETDQVRINDLMSVRWCIDQGADAGRFLADAREARWLLAAASAVLVFEGVNSLFGGRALFTGAVLAGCREVLERSFWAGGATRRVLARGRRDLPFRMPRSYSKRHLLDIILTDEKRDPACQARDLSWSFWNLVVNRLRLRCIPPSLITVSGPDGSGKSEIAGKVAHALELCEVPARVVWGRGGFSWLAVAGKALLRKTVPSTVPAAQDESAKRAFMRSGFRRWIYSWLMVLEQAVAMQRIRFLLASGHTVICDRYVYDSMADFRSRLPAGNGNSLPSSAAAFLLGASRSPDLAMLIDVDPVLAHARKNDGTSLQSRKDLAAAYGEISMLFPFRHVDGSRSLEQVQEEAVTASLHRCFSRFLIASERQR
jgi:thymidylate kinase